MKKTTFSLISILFMVSLCFAPIRVNADEKTTVTPVQAHGKLSVKGTNIVDKNGNKFQLRGVSTHGIGLTNKYHKFISQESFNYMRDEWGINAVRLTRYTPNNDGSWITLNREEFVKEAIEYAISSGLYVMIDWHVFNPGDPNAYKTEAIEYFKYYANLFKDYPNIIYEIANEPNDQHPEGVAVTWQDSIKPYSEEVISEIRKIDNDAIIVVGTPGYSHDLQAAVNDPIDDKNVVYSYHFYAADEKDKKRKELTDGIESGLPVLISECGMVNSKGDGAVDADSATKWMEILDDKKIGYFVWQLTNKAEGSSLIRNDIEDKYTNWTYDELSEHGKWLVDNLKRYPDDNKIINMTYNYLEGANLTYTLGVDKNAIFRIDADYSLFGDGGKVYVDDNLVDPDNYDSKSGSTIITLKKSYLDSLSVGRHTLKVVFNNDGTATTSFTIAAKIEKLSNPKTSDPFSLYITMLGLSIIGLAGAGLYIRKRRFN